MSREQTDVNGYTLTRFGGMACYSNDYLVMDSLETGESFFLYRTIDHGIRFRYQLNGKREWRVTAFLHNMQISIKEPDSDDFYLIREDVSEYKEMMGKFLSLSEMDEAAALTMENKPAITSSMAVISKGEYLFLVYVCDHMRKVKVIPMAPEST